MWAQKKKPAAAAQVCAAALLTRAPSKTRPGEAGDVRDLRVGGVDDCVVVGVYSAVRVGVAVRGPRLVAECVQYSGEIAYVNTLMR